MHPKKLHCTHFLYYFQNKKIEQVRTKIRSRVVKEKKFYFSIGLILNSLQNKTKKEYKVKVTFYAAQCYNVYNKKLRSSQLLILKLDQFFSKAVDKLNLKS